MSESDEPMVLFQFRIKPEFAEAIRLALKQHPLPGGKSQFVRDAMREKLIAMNYDIPVEMALANDREGVGGRPTHRNVPAQKRSDQREIKEIEGIMSDVSNETSVGRKTRTASKIRQSNGLPLSSSTLSAVEAALAVAKKSSGGKGA